MRAPVSSRRQPCSVHSMTSPLLRVWKPGLCRCQKCSSRFNQMQQECMAAALLMARDGINFGVRARRFGEDYGQGQAHIH